jgi:hypothetical protein
MRVEGSGWSLTFEPGRPLARFAAAGGLLADLSLAWSVDRVDAPDSTLELGSPVLEQLPDRARVALDQRSLAWSRKRLVFDCFPDRLEGWVEVEGEGRLASVHLLGGQQPGSARWNAGWCASEPGFTRLWNPEPARWPRVQSAAEGSVIDVLGGPVPGMQHWLFTPAPWFYAVAGPQGPWLGLGLDVERGAHRFTAFHWDARPDAFNLRLTYEGMTTVDGRWRSPALLLQPGAADPYAALSDYVGHLEVAPPALAAPAWWSRPIFCGWGQQVYEAGAEGGAPALSSQARYDRYLGELEVHGVDPGTVVVDDRWQATYGANEPDRGRWPDLRGWIAARHAEGRRVLLWLKAWDPEGLDEACCVTDALGRPVATDPTSPAYRALFASTVERLLGPAALDADGFKLDFTGRTPSGPGLRVHGDLWGAELLHALIELVVSESRRVKPDALVMTHCCNPYFADVTPMLRLNDVNVELPVVEQMEHRARVARIALPGALVDTDNWPMPDRAAWREYLAAQPRLGIPSLYFTTHLSFSGEPLEEADYAALRESWAGMRA